MFQSEYQQREIARICRQSRSRLCFFIDSEPAFATGIGSCLSPIDMGTTLTDCHVIIIKPSIAISTKSAYAHIHPHHPDKCCRDIINQPMETWKHELTNDFEEQAFKDYPELQNIKTTYMSMGPFMHR